MLENKKVIIFDIDGTLIDSIGIWNKIDERLINTIGTVKIDNTDIGIQRDLKLKEFSKYEDTYLEYFKFLKEKYKSEMSVDQIKKIRYQIANDYLKNEIDYKLDAENVLKYLKQKNFILAIATTTNEGSIEIYKKYNKNIINKANFESVFSIIFSKSDVKELKPNPEVHYKILKALNVKPSECLIIEDSLIGIEAANNANIDVVAIYDKYSNENREKINKLSQYQFENFTEMLEKIKEELEHKKIL